MDLSNVSAADLKAALKKKESDTKGKRKAYKELVEDHVPLVFQKLELLSKAIADTKSHIFLELQELIKNKQDAYGIKSGQQSHSLTDSEGRTITIGYRVLDGWDDTVHSGIAKVSNFISSLAKDDESAKLVNLVNGLLKKDHKGNLKSSRVLELKNMVDDFDNEEFSDGVEIISQSYHPTRSCYFLEASYKDQEGNRQNIPLSMSAVDFGKGADKIDLKNF